MAIVNLNLFKRHVRADDFAEDDEYLEHLLEVAEETVIGYTHRTEAELVKMGGGQMPKAIEQAVMFLAAHWYNQREGVSTTQMHQVPDTMDVLIKPYRKLVEEVEGER